MSDELKPCPFCGGLAEIVDIDEGENAGGSCVCCTTCLASSNVEFGFKENFISNWNRRVQTLAPDAVARLVDAITPAPQPEAATPTAQEAEAVMRQWPDPLTSDMARAVEQHREILLVEIMSMFDKMQRELDYSRGGKLGPVDPPQPSETVAAVERAFDKIRELNMSGRDENGHRWANSDLIDQTVTEGLVALRAREGGAA